jgi:hypothetical protein
VDQDSIRQYVASTFRDVDVQVAGPDDGSPEVAWGDTFFIHHDDRHRFPFATIVTKDYGDFDNLSNLNREGVYRLNIGVSKETFHSLFAGDEVPDYSALDRLIPHPVYARNHWVSVLNPSDETFQSLRALLGEAYEISAGRVDRRKERVDERT